MYLVGHGNTRVSTYYVKESPHTPVKTLDAMCSPNTIIFMNNNNQNKGQRPRNKSIEIDYVRMEMEMKVIGGLLTQNGRWLEKLWKLLFRALVFSLQW